MKKPILNRMCAALFGAALLLPGASALAQEKTEFTIAWTIYAGWMPWKHADESGIMKKWADKYGIKVNIVQINDYVESINQFTAGQFDGVVATSMDALSIPSASGVDTTALIVGDYSNGNDGIVSKKAATIAELKDSSLHLVELSVSHYLLARALDSAGLRERDVTLVNTSDADIVAAFQTEDVTSVVTWNPLLDEVAAMPGAKKLYDSSQVPGHIKDLTVVNTATLADNPALGKALVGAWFEMMTTLQSEGDDGQKMRAFLGEASGTDQAGYEAQLGGMMMFWKPAEAVAFVNSEQAFSAMDSVRKFSFEHGLLGEGAPDADFIGISFPGGKLLGDAANIKFRFDTSYMEMAADGKL
jgi:NitT/TauT family transport system substrate-binding protein